MKTKTSPKQTGIIFKSIDPAWPKWACSPARGNTRWFNTKEEALHFWSTGDDSKAIAGK